MKKIVIFGSSGHAKVVLSEILKLKKFKFLGFIDSAFKSRKIIEQIKEKKYLILGDISYLRKIYDKNTFGIVIVNVLI